MARFSRPVALLALAAVIPLVGCAAEDPDDPGTTTVYATTGYLADAVANIAPDVDVTAMVGPGGDPHTHQPSTQDVQRLRSADLVFWNGLGLEAQMEDQLASLGGAQLAVGDELPAELLLPWEDGMYDPHVWNSPEAWRLVVDAIADRLAAHDPGQAETYRTNAEDYRAQIDETAAAAEALAAVSEPRILITGHDAFNYFGDAYDLEVRATDFISTQASLSPTEMSELADCIVDNEVSVIFQDNQANPQAITALREAVESRDWSVTVSTEELFADTLGPTPPLDTYLGVLEHNAGVVAAELEK